MAVFVPSYIYLSKHHVWYFRWPVPAALHRQRKARHIRLSLGTRDPKEALRLSKHLEYHALRVQERLTGMDYLEVQNILKKYFVALLARRKEAINKDGILSSSDIASLQNTLGFLEQAVAEGRDDYTPTQNIEDTLERFIEQHKLGIQKGTRAYEQLKADFKFPFLSYCKEVLNYNSGLRSYDLSSSPTVATPTHRSGLPLKKAVDDFIAERVRGGAWSLATKQRRETQLLLLCDIIGNDIDIVLIDSAKVAEVKKTLQVLPKHRDKKAETRHLSLKDSLNVTDVEKLDAKTIDDYLTTYQSFFAWAERQSYVQKNFFSKITIRARKGGKDESKKDAFTKDQMLQILTALPQHTPEKIGKSYPYWGTLIGIYTGARVNEIA